MKIVPVDNNISYQNSYANKIENRQDQSISAADNTISSVKAESLSPSVTLDGQNDEYSKSGDDPEKFTGIYQLEKDEFGKQKIVFNPPSAAEKSEQAGTMEKQEKNEELSEVAAESYKDSEQPEETESSEQSDGKKDETYTTDTSRVDAEIKKLKEEKQQIEQQLKNVQDDEDKRKELEKRLSSIESELNIKDNDAYRKQNATYTYN